MRKVTVTIALALLMMMSGLATSAPSASAASGVSATRETNIQAVTRWPDGKPGVYVSWIPVSSADGYNIYRDGRYIATKRGSSNRSYHDFDVNLKTYSKRYTYKVVSFKDSPRAFANGTPVSKYLKAPKPTQATVDRAVVSQGKVLVLFRPSNYAAGYNVYRDGRYLKSIRGTDTYFNDKPSAGTYSYTVIAYGYRGNYFVPARGTARITYRG